MKQQCHSAQGKSINVDFFFMDSSFWFHQIHSLTIQSGIKVKNWKNLCKFMEKNYQLFFAILSVDLVKSCANHWTFYFCIFLYLHFSIILTVLGIFPWHFCCCCQCSCDVYCRIKFISHVTMNRMCIHI